VAARRSGADRIADPAISVRCRLAALPDTAGPMRKLVLAITLLASTPAFGQAPPPVPALPDTERRTSYSLSSSTCTCAVGFALYGDGSDYGNWIEVWINGVLQSSSTYTITSPTGPIGSIARPITDAVLTFNSAQSGTVQIVGARRPRRSSQFNENQGVAARDLNQALTDIVAQNRETWDRTNDVNGRTIRTQPGNVMNELPAPTNCVNGFVNLGADGLTPTCSPGSGGGASTLSITRAQIPTTNTNAAAYLVLTGYNTANDRGFGAPYTCIGQSSTSWGAIRDSAGNWCGLILSQSQEIVPGWFGARADDGGTTIGSGDIAAHSEWRGTYTAGTTWDTVGTQEAIYAAFALNSTPGNIIWNFNGSSGGAHARSNLVLHIPTGYYGINKQLISVVQAGKIIFDSKSQAAWDWYGDPNTTMWLCDSCSYTQIYSASVFQGVTPNYGASAPLISFDATGTYNSLKTQQDTFYDLYVSNAQNGRGVAISNSGNGAQGDTVTFINPFFGGFMSDYALKLGGDNTLNIVIIDGDFQGYQHDAIANFGGQINTFGTHSENQNGNVLQFAPPMSQVTTGGGDLHTYSVVNGSGSGSLQGWRAEDTILVTGIQGSFGVYNGGVNLLGSGTIAADGQYFSGYPLPEGVITTQGTKNRTFLNVDSAGTDWRAITGGTGTNVIQDATASYTVNQWVGYVVQVRFGSNGFFNHCGISANTATSVTIDPACSYTLSSESLYKIVQVTGGSPPAWDSAPSGNIGNFIGSAPYGFTTHVGSTCVDVGPDIYGGISVGNYIAVPNAAQIAPVSGVIFPNILMAKVSAKSTTACLGGGGNSVTVNRAAAYALNNVAGYYGATISDNGIQFLEIPFDAISGGNVISDVYVGAGKVGAATMSRVGVLRNDWQDPLFNSAITPGQRIQNYSAGATTQAQCASITPAATIDLTNAMLSCNYVIYQPTSNTTINAPLPPGGTQEFTLVIQANSTNNYTITFGTNFVSNGVLWTGVNGSAYFTVVFRSDGSVWREASRSVLAPGTIPPFTIAALPTCTAGSNAGLLAMITNGVASPTYNSAVSTTGSTNNLVFCNGAGWFYH
jgi:hypothetical protein